jgi:hypothetical protein
MLECKDSTISGNKAALGGDLYTDFDAIPYIINSNFTDNTAEQAGGAWFTDNTAEQAGGAWFGNDANQEAFQTDEFSTVTNNNAACCFVSGYGSTLQRNSTSTVSWTCADVDSGT